MSSTLTTDLSGIRKAALLLVQLGPEQSAPILKSLRPEEIEALMTEVARMDVADEDTHEAVVREFESLAIASRNRVTVAQIKDWNHLKHDKVAAGTSLQLTVPYKAQARHVATRVAARKVGPVHRVAAKPAPRRASVAVKQVKKKRG